MFQIRPRTFSNGKILNGCIDSLFFWKTYFDEKYEQIMITTYYKKPMLETCSYKRFKQLVYVEDPSYHNLDIIRYFHFVRSVH